MKVEGSGLYNLVDRQTDRWLCLVTGDLITNWNAGILIMVSSMFAYFSVSLMW
jgi:hypothetical protein